MYLAEYNAGLVAVKQLLVDSNDQKNVKDFLREANAMK